MGKVRGALGLCSNAEARHFSKLLTENHEKMWRQRDNMAIAVFHQQFARFMVGKFQVSKYAPVDTDVEMSNLYSWFCEDAKEGDEGRGQRHPREGEEGATCLTTHQSTVEPNGVLFGRMPFRLTLHAL